MINLLKAKAMCLQNVTTLRTLPGHMTIASAADGHNIAEKIEITHPIFYLASRLKRRKSHMEIITSTRKTKQHYTK
jgi:hypothetical protein